jgi:hypothetical protein
MSKTSQSKQLKDEIFGHKEIVNETLELPNDELAAEEKIDFCNAIIKYLESKKVKIEESLYEEISG